MASSVSGPSVGDRVIVHDTGKDSRRGLVKFVGETHFGSGIWCGLCLDLPLGKNDGTVNGVKYFECLENFGLFVPVGKVKLEKHASPLSKKATGMSTRSRLARSSFGGRRMEPEMKLTVPPSKTRKIHVIDEENEESQTVKRRASRVEASGRDSVVIPPSNGTFSCSNSVTKGKRELHVRQSLPVPSRAKQPPGPQRNSQNLSRVVSKPQDQSMVAKARAAAADSHRRQQKKQQEASRNSPVQSTSETADHQANVPVSYQATDNSGKAKNDTFTVNGQASAKPTVSEEAEDEDSLPVDDLHGGVLIENISQCQLQSPLSSSTPWSSGDQNHPVVARHLLMVSPFTPCSEAIVLEEASRLGQCFTQSACPLGLPDVVKQLQVAVTGEGERGAVGLGSVADNPVDVMTGLRDHLRSTCRAFDAVAVVVGHLMMKLENCEKDKRTALKQCTDLQCQVDDLLKSQQLSHDKLTVLVSEKAQLQEHYDTACSKAAEDKLELNRQLKMAESSKEALRLKLDTLMSEYETKRKTMQEANDRLSSELGTVTEECKSQVAEVQHEVEYLKENIQSLADEKAMDIVQKYKSYADEVESFKAAMDLKAAELREIRRQSLSLQEQADSVVDYERKARTLQSEKEQLKEQLDQQRHCNRQLNTEVESLKSSLQRERHMKEEMEHSFEQEIWRVKQEDMTMNHSSQDGSFKLVHALQRLSSGRANCSDKEMMGSCPDSPFVSGRDAKSPELD